MKEDREGTVVQRGHRGGKSQPTEGIHETVTLGKLSRLGWSLIPTNLDKRPMFPWKEYQNRRATEEEMDRWRKHSPPAWAVVTGKLSKIITLDFDGPEGKKTIETLGLLPHRRTARGGFHADVVHPGRPVQTLNGKSCRKLGQAFPGLDVRGDGGYANVLGKSSAGSYEWLRPPEPYPLHEIPSSLAEMVGLIHRDEFSTADKVAEMLADAIANASMGARNETGFKLARALRDLGLSRAAAEPIMKSYQSAILHKFPNADPYGLRESLATLSSVYQRSSAIPGRREREIKVHEETSGTDLNVPPGFFLGSDGVYATDSSGYFRVCSRLEVTGFARGLRNGNWGIVLKFNDRDRNMHEWVMPMELLASDGTEIRGRLLSMGLEIEPGTPVRHALSRYISLAKSEGRVRLVLLWLVR